MLSKFRLAVERLVQRQGRTSQPPMGDAGGSSQSPATVSRVGGQYCSQSKRIKEIGSHAQEPSSAGSICSLSNTGREVDAMRKILLVTVSILAFAAPSFAQDKTVGQAPPSGASSFYLAQDTATMKCQVVNAQPAAGGNMKVIGAAHPTQASAQTALTADKTCK